MQYWNQETINKIRKGYYSAVYFNRTKQILLNENNLQTVTMQLFQKQNATICGIDQVIALLKNGAGYFEKNTWIDMSSKLEIHALSDGEDVKPWDTVMHIKGPYPYFAHLESLYLGILARATKIATNTKKVVTAANKKQVIFFAVRLDTSEKNIDKSLMKLTDRDINGVNKHLVNNVRNALDKEGFQHIKIVVSGGFTADKIERFEKEKIPVDIYGVGSSLLQGNNDFTADIVEVDGKKIAKAGRTYKENKRLCNKSLQK